MLVKVWWHWQVLVVIWGGWIVAVPGSAILVVMNQSPRCFMVSCWRQSFLVALQNWD